MRIEKFEQVAQEKAVEFGLKKLADKVTVFWNPRMRSAAGRAYYVECRIELNPILQQVSEEEVERTFLHELAHLVAFHRHFPRKIAPHGVEWKIACADVGIPGEKATHKLPLPRRTQVRSWVYTCPKCGEQLLRARQIKKKLIACFKCCEKYNGGLYSKRFKLIESRISS